MSVDVISDVICPWCYIGKRRLEKALAAVQGKHEVRVKWLPFQLNPAIPKEGVSRTEYRIKEFGSWERSQELDAKVIAVGETEGIHFAFDRMERTPNTVDAHRLIWLADQQGCQDAILEALFRGYFTEHGPSVMASGTTQPITNSKCGMMAVSHTQPASPAVLSIGFRRQMIVNCSNCTVG